MDKELRAFIEPRTEKIQFGGKELTVRELDSAADVTGLLDEQNSTWHMLVLSVFNGEDKPVFSPEDIPSLQHSSRARMKPLIEAVMRVNGLNIEVEAKN